MRCTGVRHGFEAFVHGNQGPLLRLAMVLAGDAARAEDIVADVLVKVFERWDRVAAVEDPAAYVRRMVLNEFLSWRRRFARVTLTEPASLVELFDETDHAHRHAERDHMMSQLIRLPRKQRAVLVLRFYEGMSDQQIADLMGCSTSTVRSNTSRALATLRVRIDLSTVTAATGEF